MPSRSLSRPLEVVAGGTPMTQVSGLERFLRHPSVFLFVILTAQLMVVLDATVVNVALPHIQAALGFSGSSLSWVLNAYVLTFGGLLLLGARAGDLAGRRRVFLAGIAIFTISSLAGGFAQTSWMLLASRALQGIGAALAAPSALSLLTTAFPEGAQRVRAIGLYTTVSAAGGALGLVAGGLLTELVSWRWVMFVNVPIGVAVFALGRLVIAETPLRHGRFDLAGAITSTLGMTGVVLGLVEAGSSGWTSPLTVVTLVTGLVLLAAFVSIEKRAEEPVLPLRLLAHRVRTTANLARGLLYAGMFAVFFFTVQFLQDVQHYSPLRTGVAFLPMPLSVFLSSQLTSRVLVRRLPEKVLMLGGIASASLGLLWASTLAADSPYWHLLLTFVLLGAGLGSSFVSLTSAGLRDVEPADAGAASGLINVSQQIGAAFGLAVLVSAFGELTHHVQLGARVSAADALQAQAVLVHGLDDVFRLAVVFTLTAMVLVSGVVRRPRPAAAVVADVDDFDDQVWMAEMLEAG
jgi:EmrB/QacA subfamily drug resistance transporter